jgi:hypothetical protein
MEGGGLALMGRRGCGSLLETLCALEDELGIGDGFCGGEGRRGYVLALVEGLDIWE